MQQQKICESLNLLIERFGPSQVKLVKVEEDCVYFRFGTPGSLMSLLRGDGGGLLLESSDGLNFMSTAKTVWLSGIIGGKVRDADGNMVRRSAS